MEERIGIKKERVRRIKEAQRVIETKEGTQCKRCISYPERREDTCV